MVFKGAVSRRTAVSLDAGLAGDVLAVGDDGVDREVEAVGYLLVEHALGHADQNLFLTGGQFLPVLGTGSAGGLCQ